MKRILVAFLACGLVFGTVDFADYGGTVIVEAKPSSRPSSRPSRPSTSKPSTRPSSRPSRPSTSKPSTRPSSRPSTSSSKPSTRPSSRPSTSSSSKPSSKPGKPSTKGFDSKATSAQRQAQSKKKFTAATKPKESYTTKSGRTVKIDSKSPSTQRARNLSSDQYRNRSTRVEHHYHHHYGDRYDYYRTQPYIYVGGGYSALFWYAMTDWSLDRRAMWLYHNQHSMDRALYQQQLAENAALRSEIARLESQGVAVNNNYVDSEFKDNPDLMYSQEYVDAAYNPQPASGGGLKTFFYVILVAVLLGVLVWLVFFKQWRTA